MTSHAHTLPTTSLPRFHRGESLTDLPPRGLNWAHGRPLTVLLVEGHRHEELARVLREGLAAVRPGQPASDVRVQVPDATRDLVRQVEELGPNLVAVTGGGGTVQRLLLRCQCSLLVLPDEQRSSAGQDPPRVLVPVDFSEESRAATLFALDLAEAHRPQPAEVHLMHVYQVGPGHHKMGWSEAEFERRVRAAAEERMAAFVQAVGPASAENGRARPPLRTFCVRGCHPARTVLERAEEQGHACLVIGARPRTTLTGLLMQSFVRRAVFATPAPTWVVRDALPSLGLMEAMWSR